jgi:hypothetical protein
MKDGVSRPLESLTVGEIGSAWGFAWVRHGGLV